MVFTPEEQLEIISLIENNRGPGQMIRRSAFYRLYGVAPTADIRWRETVAVGGGAVRYGRTGITSITDAGAAGIIPINYNPTTNQLGIGTAPAYNIDIYDPTQARIRASNVSLMLSAGLLYYYDGAGYWSLEQARGLAGPGWLLAKGVGLGNESFDDFIGISYAVGAAPGVSWILQAVTAPVVIAARGGIVRLSTANTVPSTLGGLSAVYSSQDAYRVYARVACQQIANTMQAVGLVDAVPGAGPGSLPHTADGAYCVHDTAISNNWILRTIRAGAVHDEVGGGAAAVGGAAHDVLEIISTTAGIVTAYFNGVLFATCAAVNAPVTTTLLRKMIYTNNLGAAILAQFDIDAYGVVCSRNPTQNA